MPRPPRPDVPVSDRPGDLPTRPAGPLPDPSGRRRSQAGGALLVVLVLALLAAVTVVVLMLGTGGGGAVDSDAIVAGRDGGAGGDRPSAMLSEAEALSAQPAPETEADEPTVEELLATAEYDRRDIPGRVVMADGGPLPDDLWLHAVQRRPDPEVRRISAAAISQDMSGGGRLRWSLPDMDDVVPRVTRSRVEGDGRFVMRGFPSEGAWIQTEHDVLYQADPLRYEGTEPELVVVLSRGARIEGLVTGSDQAPMAGVHVEGNTRVDPYAIFSGDMLVIEIEAQETGPDGRFVLAPVPTGAPFRLHTDDGDGPYQSTVVEVPALTPGQTYEADITLLEGGVLAGVVLDERDDPVAGIEVMIQPASFDMTQLDTLGRLDDERVDTDDDGHFAFTGLPTGGYLLALASEDYLTTRTETLEVGIGETRDDLVIRAVTGLPVGGVVLDGEGQPVPGARVKVALPPSFVSLKANAERALRPTREVDDQGRFHFTGYAEGDVRVWVQADGFVNTHFDAEAGDEDLVLTIRRRVGMSGIVVSLADGEPITDYTLSMTPSGGLFDMTKLLEMEDRMRDRRAPERVRDEDGRFSLDGVSPGFYDLLIQAPGHARTLVEGVEVAVDEGASGLVVMVPEEGVLSGTVVDGRTGDPVAGAQLTTGGADMMSMWSDALGSGSIYGRTDDEGRFELDGVGSEPVAVTITHARYANMTTEEVRLKAGERRDLGLIAMPPGAVVWGRVFDGQGRPEEGVTVLAAEATGRSMRRATTDDDGWYRCEGLAPGTYNVMRMDMQMSMDKDSAAAFLEGMVFKAVSLEPEEEKRVDLSPRDESGTTLEGLVASSAGPEADATLWIVRELGETDTRFGSTDREGRYALRGLQPGRYLLSVMPSSEMVGGGSQPSSPVVSPVTIGGAATQRLDVHVPGGVMRGEVTSARDGARLPNVRVLLHRTDDGMPASRFLAMLGGRVGEAWTDKDGRFEFRHLPTGTYSIVAGGQNIVGMGDAGWAARRVDDLAVRDGTPGMPVDIELDAGGGLTGVARDEQGRALSGVPVWARRDATGEWLSPLAEISTDGSGRFTVNSLEPGTWTLALGGQHQALTLIPGLSVRRGEVTERDVELGPGVEVFIDPSPYDPFELLPFVNGPDGVLPVHLVSMESLLGGSRHRGRIRVGRIAPGAYDLVVQFQGRVVHEAHIDVGARDDEIVLGLDGEG